MPSLTGVLSKWPLIRQIRGRVDGTGSEAMSDKTRAMHARTDVAQVVPAPEADGRTELGIDQNVRTRFVRFTVHSHGLIEGGWPGAGSMPWYFLDEIHLR